MIRYILVVLLLTAGCASSTTLDSGAGILEPDGMVESPSSFCESTLSDPSQTVGVVFSEEAASLLRGNGEAVPLDLSMIGPIATGPQVEPPSGPGPGPAPGPTLGAMFGRRVLSIHGQEFGRNHVAFGLASGDFMVANYFLRLFDASTGEALWTRRVDEPTRPLWVSDAGEVLVFGEVLDDGSSLHLMIGPDGEETALSGFDEVLGPPDEDGWFPVTLRSQGRRHPGWFNAYTQETSWIDDVTHQAVHRVGERLVFITPHSEFTGRARDGELVYIDIFELGLGDAHIIDTSEHRVLLTDHDEGTWVIDLEEETVEQIPDLPVGHSLFSCHGISGVHLGADDVLYATLYDGGSARVFQHASVTNAWEPISEAMTDVDQVHIKAVGEHIAISTSPTGSTFCPQLDFETTEGSLPGASLQLLHREGRDAPIHRLRDTALWRTASNEDGRCWAHSNDVNPAYLELIDAQTGSVYPIEAMRFQFLPGI